MDLPEDRTIRFAVEGEIKLAASDVLSRVFAALVEKGYNPVSQLVGYLLSGDPTYITSHGQARSLIARLERDELLEELVKKYFGDDGDKN